MGFNKRIIHKDTIDRNINDLTNADALIMDYWSGSFYDNLDFKWQNYQKRRQQIIDETQLYSNLSVVENHKNFDKLKNISNIYMSRQRKHRSL